MTGKLRITSYNVCYTKLLRKETTGYIIASGRYGYLGFIIPYLYEKFTDKKSLVVPEYYDYQVKIKQYLV